MKAAGAGQPSTGIGESEVASRRPLEAPRALERAARGSAGF